MPLSTITHSHRAAALFVIALLSGCGGKAVVDAASDDAPQCVVPAPVGGLQTCHGAAAVGDGPRRCSNLCIDLEQREYTSLCQAGRCECWFEGKPVCACNDEAAEDGTCVPGAGCCPSPWE